jgi:cellulose biosynthesis protein BcsQ
MSVPVLTFFNNKGGVGKTSLIYHLAWMFADLGKQVVVADLDPQANLTAAFLDDERIEGIWNEKNKDATIYQCVNPLTGVGDILPPVLQNITDHLHLLPGDVALSSYEDVLSTEWSNSMGDKNLYRPMRTLSSFWLVTQMAAERVKADVIFVDIGPNLGAINRAVLLATDYVAIPLGADLFSLKGLGNLGPALRDWRSFWSKRRDNWKNSRESRGYPDFRLPPGKMAPIGYLCQQYGVRLDRPVNAHDKWGKRIPALYREAVLGEKADHDVEKENDSYCLATLKHYRNLIPMGQEHRKPIFHLTPADGAIGSLASSVRGAKKDFEQLAMKIAREMNIPL